MRNIEELVDVTLVAPSWIKEGLDMGSLMREGGVVRWKDGKIAMLLRESGGLSRELANGSPLSSPALSSQISHLQSLSMLSLGTQVLNLGVSAAGFAVVISKLNKIQEQLDQLHGKMDQALSELGTIKKLLLKLSKKIEQILDKQDTLQEGIDWISRKQDLEVVAKMKAAIEIADNAINVEVAPDIRRDWLNKALYNLTEMANISKSWMDELISTKKYVSNPELFDLYYRTWACCSAAIVQCLLFLEEDDGAIKYIQEMYKRNEEIHQSYLHILQNFDRHLLQNIRITIEDRKRLKDTNDLIQNTTEQIRGYQLEIEFIQQNDIPYDQWITVGDSEESRLSFLIPKNDPVVD